MPRGRGKVATRNAASRTGLTTQRNQRTPGARGNNGIPNIYDDLLAEAAASTASEDTDSTRPLKKRKLAGRRPATQAEPTSNNVVVKPLPEAATNHTSVSEHESSDEFEDVLANRPLQTITDYSEESEESEEDWEDVLRHNRGAGPDTMLAEPDISGFSIDLSRKPDTESPRRARRKAATGAEKQQITGATLKRLVDRKLIPFLLPENTLSQFERSRSFLRGLDQVSEMWKSKYAISAVGLRRPHWAETVVELEDFKLPSNVDPPMDLQDFRKAAKDLEGSDDLGAQLFCALLRSIGVEARLVCSLQPLGFAATAQAPPSKPSTPAKKTVYLDHSADERDSAKEDTTSRASIAARAYGGTTPQPIKRIQRLGQRGHGATIVAGPAPAIITPPKAKSTYKPQYPVYWVEAFNTAYQKWVTVDPLATASVNNPAKLEPPMSYPDNIMSYVVAFEADGVARDVTRRYAKAYNAKTRKLRVESTEGGERWWKKAMRVFRRAKILDRDQVEDAELAKKEAAEGLPRNVQDFKDHPLYVLERHLKHNQAIHPKRESGKVSAGSGSSAKPESVYRRRDVHLVRSADKCPRRPPLRLLPNRALHPSPVVNGLIPKNAYGNLDVYVPSMVPPGGVHIWAAEAAKAARLLGVDYADAVMGFQFRGRHGTAVLEGVVVAAEYGEAVQAVVDGFADRRVEEEERKRSAVALGMWRRFLKGLRIVEHVRQYETQEEKARRIAEAMDEGEEEVEEEGAEEAGGFFPDAMQRDAAEPTARRVRSGVAGGDAYGGGFVPDGTSADVDYGGGFMPEEPEGGGFLPDDESAVVGGGGFIVGDNEGGGFMPQEDNAAEDGGFMAAKRAELAEHEDTLPDPGRRRRRRVQLSSSDEDEDHDGDVVISGALPANGDGNRGSTAPDPLVSDGEAGGFLREQSVEDFDGGNGTASRSPDDEQYDDDADSATQEAIAQSLEEMHASNNNDWTAVAEGPDQIIEETTDLAHEAAQPLSAPPTLDQQTVDEEITSSGSERGSLLSHDPEDEDAEPEWLMSD
ncbi:hypothetical protein H2199_005944 [Coniosporium tulheliwenetii]|uniref:Uncharacterized protein n=1 Tax=Coniosporium tulheliwenetii TaxID=3383036 RepID=A0ACC2YYR4_9PEZI|nr:hypothetical protein H2199_005944 [Cladosporium sp. JES 115]